MQKHHLLKKYPIKISTKKIVKIPFNTDLYYFEDLREQHRIRVSCAIEEITKNKLFLFDKGITKIYEAINKGGEK